MLYTELRSKVEQTSDPKGLGLSLCAVPLLLLCPNFKEGNRRKTRKGDEMKKTKRWIQNKVDFQTRELQNPGCHYI
jgi:hypothetical protein